MVSWDKEIFLCYLAGFFSFVLEWSKRCRTNLHHVVIYVLINFVAPQDSALYGLHNRPAGTGKNCRADVKCH